MGYLAKRKLEERERITLYLLLMIIPLLTFLGALGGGLDRRLDYIGEFKMHAAFLSVFLCLFCLYKRLFAIAGCFFLFVLMNLFLTASHYHFFEQESLLPPDAPQFTLFYQDLKGADDKAGDLQILIANNDADLVLLTNVPVSVYELLHDIAPDYVLQNQTANDEGKMMLVLARSPSSARGVLDGDDALWVSRIIGERKLTVVLSVLDDPFEPENYDAARAKMTRIADFVSSRDEPVLFIGDLKASDWSRLTYDLKETGKLSLKEPLRFGTPATYPFFLRRPVASVYAHPGIEVRNIYPVTDMDLRAQGISALVKMTPVKKEVRFYELQPTVSEEILMRQNAAN